MKRIILISGALMASIIAFAQDINITTDAQKIEAKILEVSKSEIRYKEDDNLEGPTFIIETKEISSVIYSNGKVVLYDKRTSQESEIVQEEKVQTPIGHSSNQVENKYFCEGLNEQERHALNHYLDGYPKNIVAIKGDYSLIYDKKSRIYFDVEYDNAEYGEYEVDRNMDEYFKKGNFNKYIKSENLEIDKKSIIESVCEMYNNKMLSKKCTLIPITQLDTASISISQDYKMILHIKRIDVGSGVVSVMTSGRTTTGGAIVCGNIEIIQASSNFPIFILIVYRVQGLGNAYESLRIQNVIEEIITNKLFNIKKLKLYD